jgi:hypothetical protein
MTDRPSPWLLQFSVAEDQRLVMVEQIYTGRAAASVCHHPDAGVVGWGMAEGHVKSRPQEGRHRFYSPVFCSCRVAAVLFFLGSSSDSE